MTIRLLTAEELAQRWHEVKPYVDRALEYGQGESTSHDLFMECMNKWAACFEAPGKSFAIVRKCTLSQYDQLQIVTTSGEGWDEYGPEALPILEDFAKQEGCKNIAIWGRKGWERVLPDGWKHVYSVFHKELS